MVNKALRIVLYSIFTISLLFVMPVNIYADTIDSHIRGRNYTYEPITYNEVQVSTNTYYENIGVIHITFELDDEYIGYVLPNYTIQYDNYFYGASTPNWGTLSKTFDRRIFINGSSFSFDIPVNWNSISINTAPGGDPFNYDSYTITSSDVTKYADIDSLDQIINILQDLYNSNDQIEGLLNDQLTQLQLIVSNTSLANDYLDIISQMKQWHIPIESYSAVSCAIMYNLELIGDRYGYQYYDYPVYRTVTGDKLVRLSANKNNEYTWIMYSKIYFTASNIEQFYSFSEDVDIIEVKPISKSFIFVETGNGGLYSIKFKPTVTTYIDISYIHPAQGMYVPIYIGLSSNKNISTDFALQFGLSNQLLDDIHLIADGTNDSSAASSQSDLANQQLQQDSNTLFQQEDSFKQNMNSAMQNIDTTFSLNNFGSSFMTSAQWVRTQYETLTNNTPFASLITFSLLVGLALIVIGKVYK